MNSIARNFLAPNDDDWSTVHRKFGCHDCMYASRDKLDYDSCCTHHQGALVDITLRCARRMMKQEN